MKSDNKTAFNSETIMLTLDQIDQTIEIMTNVVDRLRGYIASQNQVKKAQGNSVVQTDGFIIENNKSGKLH